MIAKAEDKIVEFFEFILDIIQMYDSKYYKKRYLLEQQSRKTGKKPKFYDRMEYITDDFSSLFSRYGMSGYNYMKKTNVLEVCKLQASLICDDIIIPIGEDLLFIYSISESRCSLLCTQIKDSWMVEQLSKVLLNCKIIMTKQWMRLDFDCDGTVSIHDINNTVKEFLAYFQAFYSENLQQSKYSGLTSPKNEKLKKKKF